MTVRTVAARTLAAASAVPTARTPAATHADGARIPLEALIFSRDIVIPGERAALYRGVDLGQYQTVARGVYVPSDVWAGARPEERHRARVRAVAALRPDTVFGGMSAALMWGRPLVGSAPQRPEALIGSSDGGRSDRGLRRRSSATEFTVKTLEGVQVTSLARSLVDTARTVPFTTAVVMLDHALSAPHSRESGATSLRVAASELQHELRRGTHVGRARARRSLEFADGASGSPGETVSRVLFAESALPAAVLQQEFCDEAGLIGFTDFFWPEYRLIGEFDGLGKYLRDEFAGGRAPADVVIAEKRREDRLRALGFTVVRWGWAELRNPAQLVARLRTAGLRAGSSTLRR